ncbi:MAG: DUF2520 domain-containing protein [Bacteroidota bacterium]|jgi:predicted short-subunit dehydrogenase-like oxidoreductase (DUF2520 family)
MAEEFQNITIIGYGKLGETLAKAFFNLKILKCIIENNSKKLQKARAELPQEVVVSDNFRNIPKDTDIIFLTVSDTAIEKTAKELSSQLASALSGKYIVHCSGALSYKILESCREYGAKIFSVHPYQTFFYNYPEILKDICWSIEPEENSESVSSLIKLTGGKPFVFNNRTDAERALYHASAVVASNMLTALIQTAKDISVLAGINFKEFFPPIINTTLNNLLNDKNNPLPMTGPYARADIETIKLHISALTAEPELLRNYCLFALSAIDTAHNKKLVAQKDFEEISDFLKKYI